MLQCRNLYQLIFRSQKVARRNRQMSAHEQGCFPSRAGNIRWPAGTSREITVKINAAALMLLSLHDRQSGPYDCGNLAEDLAMDIALARPLPPHQRRSKPVPNAREAP